MKMRYFVGLLVLLSTAPLILADEDSHHRAAEELLQVMDIQKQLDSSLEQTLDVQIKAQPALKPYRAVMRKFLGKYMSYSALKNDLIKSHCDEFSEAELRQIIAFYKTPAGKKLAARSPLLMSKCIERGQQRVAENQEEFRKLMEEELKKQKEKKQPEEFRKLLEEELKQQKEKK